MTNTVSSNHARSSRTTIDPIYGDLEELRVLMFRWIRRRGASFHFAQDLVQDALINMLLKKHLFEPGTNVKGWAIAFIRDVYSNKRPSKNNGKDHRRLPQIMVGISDVEYSLRYIDDIETTVFGHQILDKIRNLKGKGYTQALSLSILGFDRTEVLETFGIDLHSFDARVTRAKKVLKEFA